ncbi:hypothetical protein J2T08_003649 [Neorhizobium galegae]|uniref:hypothetical protein n=1 Tax=Neorhizobium galegae TaxID=399 RepID=UPI00278A9B29|nr:hypothetical protein [Neorhizobium galegae]MDQ0135728.1 hypothetical protein [Neorhizobium galegae]
MGVEKRTCQKLNGSPVTLPAAPQTKKKGPPKQTLPQQGPEKSVPLPPENHLADLPISEVGVVHLINDTIAEYLSQRRLNREQTLPIRPWKTYRDGHASTHLSRSFHEFMGIFGEDGLKIIKNGRLIAVDPAVERWAHLKAAASYRNCPIKYGPIDIPKKPDCFQPRERLFTGEIKRPEDKRAPVPIDNPQSARCFSLPRPDAFKGRSSIASQKCSLLLLFFQLPKHKPCPDKSGDETYPTGRGGGPSLHGAIFWLAQKILYIRRQTRPKPNNEKKCREDEERQRCDDERILAFHTFFPLLTVAHGTNGFNCLARTPVDYRYSALALRKAVDSALNLFASTCSPAPQTREVGHD